MEAASGFEAGREQGIHLALDAHEARVEALMNEIYRVTVVNFGERVLGESVRSGLVPERKDAPSEFMRLALDWIAEFGLQQIDKIATTTRRRTIEALEAGQEAGEGIEAIARRIVEATGNAIGRRRAEVIARTEIHAASQAASDLALEALELPIVRREWVAANDLRTRKTHRPPPGGASDGRHTFFADGQIRAQGEPFDVGGFKLLFPGDLQGPPEEIIRCRCVTAAVIEDT